MVQYPKSVLITGASRGIGLGLVEEFLKHKQVEHIFAAVRNPDTAKKLSEITDPRLIVVKLDVTCDESIKEAIREIERIVGDDGLNCLVNNAGICVNYYLKDEPNRKMIEDQLFTNTISTIALTHHLLPLLRSAANKGSWGVAHSAILNISSVFGSLQSPQLPGSGLMGFLPYKVSKAAINQFSHTLAEDLDSEGILVASFHPGWVQTDMGGPEAPTELSESVSSLVESFSNLEHKHQGGFFTMKGEPMDW